MSLGFRGRYSFGPIKETPTGVTVDSNLTLTGNITMPDGGTIGQSTGPLLTFDDTNNKLKITQCAVDIGAGFTGNDPKMFHLYASTLPAFRIQNDATGTGNNDGFLFELSGTSINLILYENDAMKFYTNGIEQMRLNENGNLGLGISQWGTNAAKVLTIGNGTAPTSSPEDCFQMYSADIVAGNAAPHFRTEDGDVIKLYQQAHIADADGTLADITSKFNTLLADLENLGLLATA